MIRPNPVLIACGLALVVLAGCNKRGVYESAYGWRQVECNKLIDPTERARCQETAGMSYEAYRELPRREE